MEPRSSRSASESSPDTDGFLAGYHARTKALLNPPGGKPRAIAALAANLGSGKWDRRHGHLREAGSYDAALRLITTT